MTVIVLLHHVTAFPKPVNWMLGVWPAVSGEGLATVLQGAKGWLRSPLYRPVGFSRTREARGVLGASQTDLRTDLEHLERVVLWKTL